MLQKQRAAFVPAQQKGTFNLKLESKSLCIIDVAYLFAYHDKAFVMVCLNHLNWLSPNSHIVIYMDCK